MNVSRRQLLGDLGALVLVPSAFISAQQSVTGQNLNRVLWEKIQSEKDELLKSDRLKYIDGISVSPPPPGLTSVHASVAQVLYYLDSQYGVIAPRHQLRQPTEAESSAQISTLESKLRAAGSIYTKEQIAAGLVLLDDEQENRYARFLRDVPASSETGFLAYLFQEHVPKRRNLSISDVVNGINKLAQSFTYQANVRTLRQLSFEAITASLANGYVPIMIGNSNDSWSTNVGYFIDEDRKKYLIVHEPRSADAQKTKEDFTGSLNHTSLPPGVKFYPADRLPYRTGIAVGKPQVDIGAFSDFLKKLLKADTR